MPLYIERGDITKVKADAIVNAANNTLLGGGGVDGAIHRAAGPELLKECMGLGGCETGDAKITRGYNLPAKYVIHTVGPIWRDGSHNEEKLLSSCYRRSLEVAIENGCRSVVFPLISSGVYGYPREEAKRVAVETITDFITSDEKNDIDVTIILYSGRISDDRYSRGIAVQLSSLRSLGRDLFNSYEEPARPSPLFSISMPAAPRSKEAPAYDLDHIVDAEPPCELQTEGSCEEETISYENHFFFCADLPEMLSQKDESFSQMVLRKIDELGMTDVECYKRANIDRKLFSKIRSNVQYKPSKQTAVAFAIALKLNMEETEELLKKAGFALGESTEFDIIIRYMIGCAEYDIYRINECLFDYDQPLLGSARSA